MSYIIKREGKQPPFVEDAMTNKPKVFGTRELATSFATLSHYRDGRVERVKTL